MKSKQNITNLLRCIGRIFATLQFLTLTPVTFLWDTNDPTQNIVNYKLYLGSTSHNYNTTYLTPTPSYTASLTQGQTYFATVTAINNVGMESPNATEISFTAPVTTITIQGNITNCGTTTPAQGTTITLTMTGHANQITLTDTNGNYQFTIPTQTAFTVTPSKLALTTGHGGTLINTIDVVAINQKYLLPDSITLICDDAADANRDTRISTIDVLAVQRFILGVTTGFASTGQYLFAPITPTINFTQTLVGNCQ